MARSKGIRISKVAKQIIIESKSQIPIKTSTCSESLYSINHIYQAAQNGKDEFIETFSNYSHKYYNSNAVLIINKIEYELE